MTLTRESQLFKFEAEVVQYLRYTSIIIMLPQWHYQAICQIAQLPHEKIMHSLRGPMSNDQKRAIYLWDLGNEIVYKRSDAFLE